MNIDKKYLDVWALPCAVLPNGIKDGGDSAAIAGNAWAVNKMAVTTDFFMNSKGPVRHPNAYMWYGRPNRFSRDQLIAVLCGLCMKVSKHWGAVERASVVWALHYLWAWHLGRFLLFTDNTKRNFVYDSPEEHRLKATPDVPYRPEWKMPDFTGPEIWALWIRCWRAKWLWPLLIILDLETLASAISWRFFRRNDTVARNHLLITLVSTSVMPTPTSWLAKWITPVEELKNRWRLHCDQHGEPYLF